MIILKKYYPWILVAATLIFLVLPIEIPYYVKTQVQLLPSEEWMITRINGDQFTTKLTNRITGAVEKYQTFQFDRGDVISIAFAENISAGSKIGKNDTVAYIGSKDIEREISRLRGEIKSAEANLEVYRSSEKESIISEEEERLNYARKQFEEQEKLNERNKKLFAKQLISEEDFQISERRLELYRINIRVREEKLASVKTGSKSSLVGLAESNLESLEEQLEAVLNKYSAHVLTSPIDGSVFIPESEDTLLKVGSRSAYTAIIPVESKYFRDIKAGSGVELSISEADSLIHTKVVRIDNQISNLLGKKYILLFSTVGREDIADLYSVDGDAAVELGKFSPFEYSVKFIKYLF